MYRKENYIKKMYRNFYTSRLRKYSRHETRAIELRKDVLTYPNKRVAVLQIKKLWFLGQSHLSHKIKANCKDRGENFLFQMILKIVRL